MISFDKIVKILLRKWWKVVLKEEIFEILDPEKKPQNKNFLDKTIYLLKTNWVIISLKSWIYIIPDEVDKGLNTVDLFEKYFFQLFKKIITYNVNSSYFISGDKSLEIHLKDFSLPKKIFVVNRSLNKKVKFWDIEVIFKTISWNADSINKKKVNLYSKLEKFVVVKNVEWIEFKVSCLELSLVESALVTNTLEWVNLTLLTKAIKKYSKIFDKSIFYEIWKFKFIMSFNRLKEISKPLNNELYLTFLDIIKKNGWLFIWEWLRKVC